MGRIEHVGDVDYEAALLEDSHDMSKPPHHLYAPFDYGGEERWKNMSKGFMVVRFSPSRVELMKRSGQEASLSRNENADLLLSPQCAFCLLLLSWIPWLGDGRGQNARAWEVIVALPLIALQVAAYVQCCLLSPV